MIPIRFDYFEATYQVENNVHSYMHSTLIGFYKGNLLSTFLLSTLMRVNIYATSTFIANSITIRRNYVTNTLRLALTNNTMSLVL